MSNHPFLIVTNLLLVGNCSVAGDVLQVDSVDSTISAWIESTCPGGDQSYGDTAVDFASLPIEIDEDASCGLPGGTAVPQKMGLEWASVWVARM